MKRIALAVLALLLVAFVAFAQTPEEATLTAPVESLQPNAVRIAGIREAGMLTPNLADDDAIYVELAYFHKAVDGALTLIQYSQKLEAAGYPQVVAVTNGDPAVNTDNLANTCRIAMLGQNTETAAQKLVARPRRLLRCLVDNGILPRASLP